MTVLEALTIRLFCDADHIGPYPALRGIFTLEDFIFWAKEEEPYDAKNA